MLPTLEKEKDNYDIPFRQCLIAAHLFHLILTATIMQWVTNLPMGNCCNGNNQWGHCYIIVRMGNTIPLGITNIMIAMGMNIKDRLQHEVWYLLPE